MQLAYYQSRLPNFGDDLNPEIWTKLAPDVLDDRRSDEAFVGIGTIIGIPSFPFKKLNVFSSGVGDCPVDSWADRQVRYWCVRGPLSAHSLGLDEDAAISDGAILVPLIWPPQLGRAQGRISIVPHWQTLDYGGWEDVAKLTGFDVIDPRDTPLKVIEKIAQSKLVLAESLHGAIIADSYDVPWRSFATSKNFSVAKWVDWTSSIDVPLEVTLVPPPSEGPVVTFGKRQEPFGTTVKFSLEDGLAEFGRRTQARHSTLKMWVKKAVKAVPGARKLAGSDYSPNLTAEALVTLAQQSARLSDRALLARNQDRMLRRLEDLKRYHGS
ncbi:polysaccharide pyruvyl transferase family protein [Bradyrhizobium manausense]|uniref:polysaccharide pyruvyl transferase family protein n=1 Tax=Bradyrhizobium manausense TaxID=989370 RepID=UPI001BAD5FE6|nr:polysaccharide pyruvyl transferase family protein [Bradyrhizobium manausense]MBR1092285.1 polysaccharide pyruvyl transferase family protein [Bradyrhizobium manausense]